MSPLVSIILVNHNYGPFLQEAIQSCLCQDHSPLEVIVVDDGSTDDSRNIISEFGDKIIPVLKSNGGQASAFNAGFTRSRGEFICLMDADDIFLPQKVSSVVKAFEQYPGSDWCFHAVQCIGQYHWSAVTATAWMKDSPNEVWTVDLREDSVRESKLPYIPPTSANVYRRSLLAKILPMPEDTSITFNDYYIHLAAFHLGKGILLKERLTNYRIHGQNDSLHYSLHKRGHNYIYLAYWLRNKYPGIGPVTNNLLCQGSGFALASFSLSRKKLNLVTEYLRSDYQGNKHIFWLKVIRSMLRSYAYELNLIWRNFINNLHGK